MVMICKVHILSTIVYANGLWSDFVLGIFKLSNECEMDSLSFLSISAEVTAQCLMTATYVTT